MPGLDDVEDMNQQNEFSSPEAPSDVMALEEPSPDLMQTLARKMGEDLVYVRRTIRGDVQPLKWISDRKGRIFGELPDVSQPLAELKNETIGLLNPRAARVTNGLPCNGVTRLSPDGDSLAFVLPVSSDNAFCQAVILPTVGSSLTLECPFFTFPRCQREYLYVTDGADRKQLYCDGRQLEPLSNLQQLFLLYERKQTSDAVFNAYCTVTARYNTPPSAGTPAAQNAYQICPASCGKALRNSGTIRIIGGSLAEEGAYPWMAKLVIKMKNGNAFQCGGSIINSRNILTAAHCLEDKQKLSILVSVGRTGTAPVPTEQRMEATEFIVHEAYSSNSGVRNDILVINRALV
ncbi:hypothetical protein HAZT_HAZT010187 [Hyalella azteca]|uniref:Peptidase S1 domain-containing protein n=1 Tax=Hyalella azteca TaxID=294128 RepID=A0A6A0H2Y3_HYAAZ|nr:hypothetical protein HAZT_HAZT010187 [Hyalella azteca]